MDPAKIRLSPAEMELVTNGDWILTKNAILDKTRSLLGELCEINKLSINANKQFFPPEVLNMDAKISKGENYKGLPYLILDYPRYFDKENVFAIRTMFWWGHFFSTTLHLSGEYKIKYAPDFIHSFSSIANEGFYTCVHASEWEHDFESTNYRSVEKMSKEEWLTHIDSRSFLKLSKKIPLTQWDDALQKLAAINRELTLLLKRS